MPVVASIPVDRTSPVPLYYQVAQTLERAIESGELPAGSRLENEIALADQLGLSRPTVRRAMDYLVDRGLLVRKRGVGTQVAHPRVRRPVELTSLFDDLTNDGRRPTTTVLALDVKPADDAVAHALGLPEGTPVTSLRRLRYADGEPLAVMRNHLPVGQVTVTRESLERHGLYQLMRASGVRPHLASQSVGARAATGAEGKLLQNPRGSPLLTVTRVTYDAAGRPIEYGTHLYKASQYSFEVVLIAR